MSYYFNGDLEDFLLTSKTEYTIEFNPFNEEFEYFIALLENETICTKKIYSPDYINYLKYEFNCDLKTTKSKVDAKLWCFQIYDLKLQKRINSRFFTKKYSNKYNEHQAIKIYDQEELEEGFVYKEDISVSGMGNYLYPRDKKKLYKVLKDRPLLKEKLLSRTEDISSLVDGNDIYHYQNTVDEYFQYKGTFIGRDFKNETWFVDYKDKLTSFMEEELNIQGPYAVDSFVYEDKLHFLSEINNRKTMGYIAHKLKEKYFNGFPLFKSILIPSKKVDDFKLTYSMNLDNTYLISPRGNLFCYFVVVAHTEDELKRSELNLYSRIFD